MKFIFAHEFGKAFVPKKIRPNLRRYLLKAGIIKEPYSFFGMLFYTGFGMSLLFYLAFILPKTNELKTVMATNTAAFAMGGIAFAFLVVVPFLIFAVMAVVMYFIVDLIIYHRTRQLEEILPYFFDVLSSNLRGGLSFDRALWMSIKPQFGIMSNEVGIAAKKVMTGHDIEEALLEFSDKYHSPMLKRSIDLIVSQLQEGGAVAEIIDKLAENIKKTRELKQEMIASLLSYIIFISVIVIFISPTLFALSKHLFEIIKSVINVLATSVGAGANPLGLTVKKISIESSIFDGFSRVSLGIIALFSAMIVSIIEKGTIRGGIKYMPIYLISSQVIYVVMSIVFANIFGSINF